MKPLKILVGALIATSIMACGKGLNTLSDADMITKLEDGGAGGGGGVNGDMKMVDFKGRDSRDGSTIMFEIDKTRETLDIIIPIPVLMVLGLVEGKIDDAKCAGITYKNRKLADNSYQFTVSVPLICVAKASLRDELTLPNGDALPAFPSGEGAMVAFSFPQKPNYRLHIYLAYGAAAAYIELPDAHIPAPWGDVGPIEIMNENQTKVVGYFALRGETASSAFGAYVAAHMPAELAAFLDDYFRVK